MVRDNYNGSNESNQSYNSTMELLDARFEATSKWALASSEADAPVQAMWTETYKFEGDDLHVVRLDLIPRHQRGAFIDELRVLRVSIRRVLQDLDRVLTRCRYEYFIEVSLIDSVSQNYGCSAVVLQQILDGGVLVDLSAHRQDMIEMVIAPHEMELAYSHDDQNRSSEAI